MSPALHVQIITTRWTKQSRGGELAGARNRVPLVFPVQATELKRGALSVQIFLFGERDYEKPFLNKRQQLDLEPELHFEHRAFSLDWDGQNAITNWKWSWWGVGAPEMLDTKAGRFHVPPDEWVRLRWQGRFSDMDEGRWWYERTIVNVARCDKKLEVDFSSAPSHLFERLPQLR